MLLEEIVAFIWQLLQQREKEIAIFEKGLLVKVLVERLLEGRVGASWVLLKVLVFVDVFELQHCL